jgi:uncharacterized hydrophobic protein (TIGR00341 family)
MLVAPYERQRLLDQIQASLSTATGWRIVVLPVEAVIPELEHPPEALKLPVKAEALQTREELYAEVETGARADVNFFLLTCLSTIVAAIGLIESNVTIVIGAMVIAPLLGPNLASILGTALGDRKLILRAAETNVLGIACALAVAVAIGLVVPFDPHGAELLGSTKIGADRILLALASGASAALSLTTGLSGALVGVMVAVALLPPAVALGLMLATGQLAAAVGAALLLATNVVCVNLAGQAVFLAQGIKPRTWLEKRSAQQSMRVSLTVWMLSLVVLSAIIYVWGKTL